MNTTMKFIQTWEIAGDDRIPVATVGIIQAEPPLVGLVLHDSEGHARCCAQFSAPAFAALADALGKCARTVCKVALDGGVR